MKPKIVPEMFPDAKVIKKRDGKEALLLDVQTSLETSIESLKKFGLVVLCLGLLLALAWPPGGLVLAVLGFLFYRLSITMQLAITW
jgi:hypothetical protein